MHTKAVGLLVAVVVSGGMLSASPASAAERNCGRINIDDNSGNVARNIRSTGMSCKLARRVVIDHRRLGITRPRGFKCTRTQVGEPGIEGELHFSCRKGTQRVRWVN